MLKSCKPSLMMFEDDTDNNDYSYTNLNLIKTYYKEFEKELVTLRNEEITKKREKANKSKDT